MTSIIDDKKAILYSLGATLLFCIGFFFNTIQDSGIFSIVRLVAVLIWVGCLTQFKYTLPTKVAYLFILVFVIFETCVLLRANNFDAEYARKTIATLDFSLPHFLPLLLLVKFRFIHIRYIFKSIYYSNIIYIAFLIIFLPLYIDRSNFEYMELLNKLFGYANGLVILTYAYHKKQMKAISLIVFLICFALALYQARRNQIFTFSLFAIFAYAVNIQFKAKYLFRNISLGIVFLGLIFLFNSNIDIKSNSFTSHLLDRFTEDTRSGVLDDYWSSMDTRGLIFGKGVTSTYYSAANYNLDADKNGNRSGIEAGYLDIILDGGVILLIAFLVILFIAIVRGFCITKNRFFWGFSFFLLIYIMELYPAGNPLFTLRYALVFIIINMCFDDQIIKLPSIIIRKLLA